MALPFRWLAPTLAAIGLVGCSTTPKSPPLPDAPHVALSPIDWGERAAAAEDDVARELLARLDDGKALFESLRGEAQSMTSAAWFDEVPSGSLTSANLHGSEYWVRLQLSAIDASHSPQPDPSGWGSFFLWILTGPFSYAYDDIPIDNLRLTAELCSCSPNQMEPLATIVVDSSECASDFLDRNGWSFGPIVCSIVMPPACVHHVVDFAPQHPADVLVATMIRCAAKRLAAAVENVVGRAATVDAAAAAPSHRSPSSSISIGSG